MLTASSIIDELQSAGSPEKAAALQKFFKTGKGQYGESDVFIGVTVPMARKIAKSRLQTGMPELRKLLMSECHEARLCALLILAERFKKASAKERKEIYDFYVKHADRANSWDLVDLTCPAIVGGYLSDKSRETLYRLAGSDCLWKQRIAIVSTMAFIRNGEFADTLALAEKLLDHPHDLIHKAVGWMLREVGKRDKDTLTGFLDQHAAKMPRTALRYAIEHYPEAERKDFLSRKNRLS